MCNAVTEALSLFNNSRDILKGNFTKIPEAFIESKRVVSAIKSTNPAYNPHGHIGDSFIKEKAHKAWHLADDNSNKIELVMGLINLRKDKDKIKNGASFLSGFAASKAIESCMESKKGSHLLNKVSEALPKGVSKIFNLSKETAQKVLDVSKYIISGTLYHIVSDKIGSLGSKISEKAVENLRKNKKLI